jgi:hypothetical protein
MGDKGNQKRGATGFGPIYPGTVDGPTPKTIFNHGARYTRSKPEHNKEKMMAMNLCGWNPCREEGEFFRAPWAIWDPLWHLCYRIAPEVTEKVADPWYDFGDGLIEVDSQNLSSAIWEALSSGQVAKILGEMEDFALMIPADECQNCSGTGNWVPSHGKPFQMENHCHKCDGAGMLRGAGTVFILSVEITRRFAEFLENCGGFRIVR